MRDKSIRRRVERSVETFLKAESFALDSPVLVAYSGGPDSTALLAALSSAYGGKIGALYVDHGIRPEEELASERDLVRRNCARFGAVLTIARLRRGAVESRARGTGLGIEEAARLYRHAAIMRTARTRGAAAVFLGHTRDDQLETMLMRLFRGSGLRGTGGIAARNGILRRPFLSLDKSVLLEYLREIGAEYSVDSTNASVDYLRNRMRHILVPVLDEVLPGWERGLELAGEKAKLDEEALTRAAGELALEAVEEGGAAVEAARFDAAPAAIRLRALRDAMKGSADGPRRASGDDPSFRESLAAIRALEEGALEAHAGPFTARREGSMIELRRRLDFPGARGYFVVVEGAGRYRAGRLEVVAEWIGADSCRGLRKGSFVFPLVVRSRRRGDSLRMPSGAKRVDDLLSEWGIPEARRDAIPIVEDRDGIVAVLGSAFGARDRFRLGGRASGDALSVIVKGVRIPHGFRRPE